MANTKTRLKTPNNSKGGGISKLKNTSSGSVVTRKNSKLLASKDNVQLCSKDNLSTGTVADKMPPDNGIDLMKKNAVQIITKRGRIRKSKDNMEFMGSILKNELMINNTKKKTNKNAVPRGTNNNNDSAISDQNTALNYKSQESSANVLTKQTGKSKNKNPPKPPVESMDEDVREDVLNKMKSVLSPEDTKNDACDAIPFMKRKSINATPKINSSYRKKCPKERNGSEKETDPLEKAEANAAKMKQVTLSIGVVLTLALVKCDYCQKSFSNKSTLARHMLSHVDLRPHHCSHCPRKFRYQTTLKAHLQRHHPTSNKEVLEFYVCQVCDKAFLMKENLELHYATHVKNENSFKCLYCDKKFSYRLLLVEHEKSHLVTGRFKCYLCDMSYTCRSRLSHHIKTHTKIKEYICQFCGKEFLRLNSIKRHVRVCHGGQRIQCPICLKELKGHLSEHMRVHEQKRPHECPECGQRFTQSTQLAVHRRSHTGVRPYPCRICKRPFGHSNALMLHIRRHTGEKPFACAMCPMAFSQLPHMKTHMSKIHGKEHAYKCAKCGEFFKLKNNLDAHSKLCLIVERELSFEEEIQASVQAEDVEVESAMSLSKMRFLLALLLTMIATKDKLKFLGFNKRLIDNLLEESLEAMGYTPCKDDTLSPTKRLKNNIEILLEGTVPKEQMEKFRYENKSTEEILMLLTDEKNNK